MVTNLAYVHVCLLVDLASNRVFQALARFGETGDRRITAFRPARLPTKQATLAIRYEHDYCRVDSREGDSAATGIHTDSRIATSLRSQGSAAHATEHLRRMPQYECPGVSGEVGLVRGQDAG
jgi:hypothetical protein